MGIRRSSKAAGCEKCNFTGERFVPLLRKSVACPHCARSPRQDKGVLKRLTAAEKRRADQIFQRAALTVAREELIVTALPTDLLTTDRILQRWAVGHGSGLPFSDEEIDELVEAAQEQEDIYSGEVAKPPPLDDDTQTVVDEIVGPDPDQRVRSSLLSADPGAREYRRKRVLRSVELSIARFVWQWYCKPVPCSVMGTERGMEERRLYLLWQSVLGEVRGRFVASGHEDLVSMVRVLV